MRVERDDESSRWAVVRLDPSAVTVWREGGVGDSTSVGGVEVGGAWNERALAAEAADGVHELLLLWYRCRW